jgi:RNA-directed DNA polymerase
MRAKSTIYGVELNAEKTKVVDTLKGGAFGFLGFDLRRVRNKEDTNHFIMLTPKKKSRAAIKAEIKKIIQHGGSTPMKVLIKRINSVLAGWVNYFKVGHSSRAFSEIRDYVEMKVRTLLTRRKRRHKRSIGWRRWSNEYLYGVLGLFWDWTLSPLETPEAYSWKRLQTKRTHNPVEEDHWASRVRENFMHGSYGEGLETDRGNSGTAPVPYPTTFFQGNEAASEN